MSGSDGTQQAREGTGQWAPSMDPFEVAELEVQWRPDLTTHWLLIRAADDRAKADRIAADALEKWGGQTRIVTRSVLAAVGLGSQEFAPTRTPQEPAEETQTAPVQGYSSGIDTIPWGLHERLWQVYAAWGHGDQSAERIAERGGFGLFELANMAVGYYHREDARRRPPRGGVPLLLELYEGARRAR